MVTQQFPGITPERWNDLKTVFSNEAHIQISADEGSSETHGIQFSWLLASQVLTATITVPHFGWLLNHAGFHTEADVMAHFAKWIDHANV